MGEPKKDKDQKASAKSWFTGLRTEFHKITWLDGRSIGRQTLAVIIVCVILAVIIAVLDMGIQYGVNVLVNL